MSAVRNNNEPDFSASSVSLLFEAVASRDYNTLTKLFANQGRQTILSHLCCLNSRDEGEEKLDELSTYPDINSGSNSSSLNMRRFPSSVSRMLESGSSSSSSSRDMIQQQQPPPQQSSGYVSFFSRHNMPSDASESSSTTVSNAYTRLLDDQEQHDYAQLLDELNSFLQDRNTASDEKQQQQRTANLTHHRTVSPDTDLMLRDAASALADSRPPARFVVYHPDAMDSDPPGAPLFDGSVAQGTPPPLGGNTHTPSGGAGTILHLCCVLDVPLALALLLSMGADARASHTVFRRLMIHEAACNGSIQCLTLLLELGQKYGDDLYEQANCKVPSSRRYRDLDLPFLPRRLMGRNSSEQNSSGQHQSFEGYGFYMPQSSLFTRLGADKNDSDRQTFVQALRTFKKYIGLVEQGLITELDAARQIMEQAYVSDASKTSLVRSCVFSRRQKFANTNNFRSPSPRTIRHAYGTNGGNADGHGNTPLHWAAFKNETQCVSLLLQYQADPNARAHPSGWTPLHDAAYSNSVECIDLLLQAGAMVDARANSGATPLCFAAQEDAAEAAELLLNKGGDLTMRCCAAGGDGALPPHSRFSGYTPLHYCAHYNAHRAARVLLKHSTAAAAMEMTDLSDRLPIHVAVARGSSDVLRELLHAGARVETRSLSPLPSVKLATAAARRVSRRSPTSVTTLALSPSTPVRRQPPVPENTTPRPRRLHSNGSNDSLVTPVSSPILRSMIPPQPVTSTKPWNCLSQQAIDECRNLITQAEQNWTPGRHLLFTPADRRAVLELLRVGKRLELNNSGIFTDLWPLILSFCGRGWFEVDSQNDDESATDDEENLDYKSTLLMYEDFDLDQTENDQLSLPTF